MLHSECARDNDEVFSTEAKQLATDEKKVL